MNFGEKTVGKRLPFPPREKNFQTSLLERYYYHARVANNDDDDDDDDGRATAAFASAQDQNRRLASPLQGAENVRARSFGFHQRDCFFFATDAVFGRVESDGARYVGEVGESVRGFRGVGGEREQRRRGENRGEGGVCEREGDGGGSQTEFDLTFGTLLSSV